jgi:hypothetical protein
MRSRGSPCRRPSKAGHLVLGFHDNIDMPSAAKGGGTKITVKFAPVSFSASSTVLKTGHPSWVMPPLPGVTPPTTLVPYSAQPFA